MLLLITGSHPRHLYLAKYLSERMDLAAWIIDVRENFTPTDKDLLKIEQKYRSIYEKHFLDRFKAENNFFENISFDNFNDYKNKICKRILICDKDSLNGSEVKDFIISNKPKICLSYGCHILKDEILDLLPDNKFNIHGGISPWYRGCITHFWPSYLLEPQMTGMTMHKLTRKLDGGDILHQNSGILKRGDGIHDLACRTVKAFFSELPYVIELCNNEKFILSPQKISGKLWTASDWAPHHLDLIYKTFDNKIVDYCLDNNLTKIKKEIIRAF